MDKNDAVEEFLLTFFMDQNSLDPDDLTNYLPEEVDAAFALDFPK